MEAAWEEGGVLRLTVVYVETPYVAWYRLVPIRERLELRFSCNVSFTLQPYCAEAERVSDRLP
ncbi:hypothetical protein J31TS4_04890 [Paenibacillus sp. J31TS4]|uniref:hypothetical protein n=1 Tax=Paenibacillus sp. J31TS4 TaxID=2807195 RepID=UPI001B27AAD3|nr:hypothetical protein [Paenibacillus sp. J31TS4]GIP37209.1 hypothetical protein J31TS4_04890 [Paenibacillus sp. J31TS4]